MTDKTIKIIMAIIAILSAAAAQALPVSYYSQRSKLAEGRWVKVKVSTTGIQKIPFTLLREWGFENPENVKIYGYSGLSIADATFSENMPDDLPLQYSEQIDEAIYFYGEADHRLTINSTDEITTTRDYYSTVSYYFLSDNANTSDPVKPIQFKKTASVLTTHMAADYHEREQYNPGQAGTFFFSTPITQDADAGVYTLAIPDLAQNLALVYEPIGRSRRALKVTPEFSDGVTVTGRTLNPAIQPYDTNAEGEVICSQFPGRSYFYLTAPEGTENFTATFKATKDNNIDWVSLDYVAALYERFNRLADHGQLTMIFRQITANDNIAVGGSNDATRVWDISDPLEVTPLEVSFDGDTKTAYVTPGHEGYTTLVAFNPTAPELSIPEFTEYVVNTDLHGHDDEIDMIIITKPSLLTQAERLADIHRHSQSLKVNVVTDADIFNEFSSGSPSAIGLRRYIKMIHDRNPGTLSYLLLFGHGVFDNRHIVYDDNNYLVTYESTEDRNRLKGLYNYDTRAFGSDNFFGMLDDNFTHYDIARTTIDLGVGRIPVADAGEAAKAVDKIENHILTYGTRDDFARMHVITDVGDSNSHAIMGDISAENATKASPALIVSKAYSSLYPTQNIDDMTALTKEALAQGTSLVMFAGHGNVKAIGEAGITRENASHFTFGNHPVMYFATCSGLAIDRLIPTVGKTLFSLASGPAAIIAAGRQVYLSRNQPLMYAFAQEFYSSAPNETVGDVWRRSFNHTISLLDENTGINSLCYNLTGDPALPIGQPGQRAKVTALNSNATGNETITVNPFTTFTLEGEITETDGSLVDDFNGTVTVTILEGEKKFDSYVKNDSDSPREVTLDQDILATAGGRVEKGRWKVNMTVPYPDVTDAQRNRVVITAYTNNGARHAGGTWRGIRIGSTPATPPSDDTSGPEITEMYLDNDDFADGDGVDNTVTFNAVIAPDPSGIHTSSNTLGWRPSLTLDSTNAFRDIARAVKPASDGGATISYNLSDLGVGEHSLTLAVYDNAGNRSERSISFVVINNSAEGALSVDDNIVTEKATIDITTTKNTSVDRLMIEDATGNTIVSISKPTFPYTWTPATSLTDGCYRTRATLVSGEKRGVTPDIEMILMRH